MTCSRCNAYNGEKAEYCDQCGMKLPVERESAQYDAYGLPPVPDLTPNTVGFSTKDLASLLNETFRIYQNSFLLLLGVSVIGHIPFFVGAFLSDDVPVVITVFALGFLAGVLANAATTYIVAGQYLGYTGTVAGGYAAAIRLGPPLLGSTLIYAGAVSAAVLLSFVVIGIPLLIFILVAWFFYVQAVMVEGKRPMDALARSWDLVRGNWLRVLGIGGGFRLDRRSGRIRSFVAGSVGFGRREYDSSRESADHDRGRGYSAVHLCWDGGGLPGPPRQKRGVRRGLAGRRHGLDIGPVHPHLNLPPIKGEEVLVAPAHMVRQAHHERALVSVRPELVEGPPAWFDGLTTSGKGAVREPPLRDGCERKAQRPCPFA